MSIFTSTMSNESTFETWQENELQIPAKNPTTGTGSTVF